MNVQTHTHTHTLVLVALSQINPQIQADNLKEYLEINSDGIWNALTNYRLIKAMTFQDNMLIKTLLHFKNNNFLVNQKKKQEKKKKTPQNIKNLGIVRGRGGDLKSRYGGVDQFSLAEKMHLRGQEAPETTVYLKVNLFTLLQWHADCLIRALNKNIMWARAFAPLPPALFTNTQVIRHHLFFSFCFPSLIVGTSNRIAERTCSDMSQINKTAHK